MSVSDRQIPSLSGLRAFASLAVVIAHVTTLKVPARHAVTLFFVLSGFLITTLLSRELATTRTIDIWAFYKRRARRLLPAYYVFLVAVIALMTGRITMEIGAAAVYLSDYFNAWVKQGIVLHLWSLSVEEHYYLLWPVVLLRGASAGRFRTTIFRTTIFHTTIAGIVIAVELARFAFAASHQIYFYYSFETRVDALLIGCGLALWVQDGGTLPRWLRGRMSWLVPGGGLVLCTVMPAVLLPTIGDTVAAWCSALLIVQTIASRPLILNNRITDYLGARSYSLYLYHVLVRVVYVGLVPGSKGPDYSVHGHWNQLAIILLSVGVASLSYQYVERPFLAGRGSEAAPGRSAATGLKPCPTNSAIL